MGFFSWKTADTNESIANIHSNHPNAGRTVYLLQPGGKEPVEETAYNGYGDFGDVDAFAWLAEMNGYGTPGSDIQTRRMDGIIALDIKIPLKFSFNKDAVYEDLPASESCRQQGYFYDLLDEDGNVKSSGKSSTLAKPTIRNVLHHDDHCGKLS